MRTHASTHTRQNTCQGRAQPRARADQNHHLKAVSVPRTQTLAPFFISFLSSPDAPEPSCPAIPPHLRKPADETVITHISRLRVTYQTLWIWQAGLQSDTGTMMKKKMLERREEGGKTKSSCNGAKKKTLFMANADFCAVVFSYNFQYFFYSFLKKCILPSRIMELKAAAEGVCHHGCLAAIFSQFCLHHSPA